MTKTQARLLTRALNASDAHAFAEALDVGGGISVVLVECPSHIAIYSEEALAHYESREAWELDEQPTRVWEFSNATIRLVNRMEEVFYGEMEDLQLGRLMLAALQQSDAGLPARFELQLGSFVTLGLSYQLTRDGFDEIPRAWIVTDGRTDAGGMDLLQEDLSRAGRLAQAWEGAA